MENNLQDPSTSNITDTNITVQSTWKKTLLKMIGFFFLVIVVIGGIVFFTSDNPKELIKFTAGNIVKNIKICSFINNASTCINNGCKVIMNYPKSSCSGPLSAPSRPGGLPNCISTTVEPSFSKCVSY